MQQWFHYHFSNMHRSFQKGVLVSGLVVTAFGILILAFPQILVALIASFFIIVGIILILIGVGTSSHKAPPSSGTEVDDFFNV